VESTANCFDAARSVHVIIYRPPALVLPFPIPVIQLPPGLTNGKTCVPQPKTWAIFGYRLQKDFAKLSLDDE
jgi:hypothetical protein